MEFSYLSLILTFALSVVLILSCVFYKHRSKFTGTNLPPGSTGWPVLGESYEFLSTGWKGHPEKFIFDRMSKFSSNIFKTSLFLEPVVVFGGAAGNKFLFSNENKLVLTWWPATINKIFPAQTSIQEDTKKLKKLVPQFLKPEALQKYIGIMDTIAQRHFEMEWENKDIVVVLPLAKRYTLLLAFRLFITIEDPQHVAKFADQFELLANGIISIPINFPGTPFNKGIKASNFIRKELRAIIKQRKIDMAQNRVSSKDILSHMLVVTDDNGKHMSELDIADKILGLLIGGHDTASAVCTFIVKYLAGFPDVYDQVYKEQTEIAKSKNEGELLIWSDIHKMKYSWNVACEVMRLASPLQGGFREAITDFVFNGFSIPKGWKLYWSTNSTNLNPECFPEPAKFDPTRFEGKGPAPYTFVPFGGGPSMCPGKEFAKLEILVFMHNLVKRFKFEKVIADEKFVVNPIPAPAKGLPVRLYPHQHVA